ncbi:MAG: hypothetical protein ACFFBS_08235 [Promethearchaeota archaeon]
MSETKPKPEIVTEMKSISDEKLEAKPIHRKSETVLISLGGGTMLACIAFANYIEWVPLTSILIYILPILAGLVLGIVSRTFGQSLAVALLSIVIHVLIITLIFFLPLILGTSAIVVDQVVLTIFTDVIGFVNMIRLITLTMASSLLGYLIFGEER